MTVDALHQRSAVNVDPLSKEMEPRKYSFRMDGVSVIDKFCKMLNR